MRRTAIVATAVLLIALASFVTITASARPSIFQTTPSCPTYQVNLAVDLVNSNPITATVGVTVVTQVHVVYGDGTPTTLSPETISFLWVGQNGQSEYDNVPVVYTGTPGLYNYTQVITADMIQATGQGKVTVYVVSCSCSDIRGNRGPVSNVSSDLTLTPSDNSNINVGPPAVVPQLFSWIVPLIIAILLLIAVLLFLIRRRKKK